MEEKNEDQLRLMGHNGWKMWDIIPAGQKPKYRWQQSWNDDGLPDIIGFDGQVPIGRAFKIDNIQNKDAWFWVLYGVERRRRPRPEQGAGWETSMLYAVLRVEWCYAKMLEDDQRIRMEIYHAEKRER